MDFPNLNVWVQIGKCFDYVPQFFQITCELHGSPLTITLQPIMTARNRRTLDFGSQSDDSQSYGYGGGGGACPQSNVALHRDRWMGAAEHEDEETCAPFPNITVLVSVFCLCASAAGGRHSHPPTDHRPYPTCCSISR